MGGSCGRLSFSKWSAARRFFVWPRRCLMLPLWERLAPVALRPQFFRLRKGGGSHLGDWLAIPSPLFSRCTSPEASGNGAPL